LKKNNPVNFFIGKVIGYWLIIKGKKQKIVLTNLLHNKKRRYYQNYYITHSLLLTSYDAPILQFGSCISVWHVSCPIIEDILSILINEVSNL